MHDHNAHVDDYYHTKIKVVGPIYYPIGGIGSEVMGYQATVGDYDLDCKCGYGSTPDDAKDDLLAQLGY